MAGTYTTVQGDTWDQISKKVYGQEARADYLMANNFRSLDTFVFSAGVVLNTPVIPEELDVDLPPWRD